MTGVQTCALPICFPVTIGGGILTPANKSDINNFENVMNELPVLNENIQVLADKGYASAINREYLLKRTLS